MKINRVISWRTRKVATGFEGITYSMDYQTKTIVHNVSVLPTRARAKTHAIKWMRYINQIQKQQQTAGA